MAAEGEGRSAFGGSSFHTFKERLGSVGEHCVAPVDEEKLAVDAQLRHLDLHQFATFDLIVDGESGDERDPVAHGDESLDGFEAGQLDVHVERGLVLLKKRDDAAAERRNNVVSDEIFRSQIAEGDFLLARKRVSRIHDEDDRICVDADGFELRVFRLEGHDAQLDGAPEDLLGNAAGQRSLHHNADMRALASENIQDGQQVEAGVFVGGEMKVAAFERAQFLERRSCFTAQLEQALSVFAQELAGGGEGAFAGGALEERLADFVFQAVNGVTDGGLGSAQAHGGAGEAAFFDDGEKSFELREFHKSDFGAV